MWEHDAERAHLALDRYLRGGRVRAIALDLGVSESTARRWIKATLGGLAAEERAARVEQLQSAIESQRALASEAWDGYERERKLDEALLRGELDFVRRRMLRRAPQTLHNPPDESVTALAEGDCPPVAEEVYERPRRANQAPAYLRLALAAQREMARLQHLYDRLETPQTHVTFEIIRKAEEAGNASPASPASDELSLARDNGATDESEAPR